MIGLLCLCALAPPVALQIFITPIADATRLAVAKAFGATAALPPGAELDELIGDVTGGDGVDLVVEAVGRNETIAHAIAAVRKGGAVVLVGNISPEINLPLQKVVSFYKSDLKLLLRFRDRRISQGAPTSKLMESGAVPCETADHRGRSLGGRT